MDISVLHLLVVAFCKADVNFYLQAFTVQDYPNSNITKKNLEKILF